MEGNKKLPSDLVLQLPRYFSIGVLLGICSRGANRDLLATFPQGFEVLESVESHYHEKCVLQKRDILYVLQ